MAILTANEVIRVMEPYVATMIAKAITNYALSKCRVDPSRIGHGDMNRVLREFERGVKLYVRNAEDAERCIQELRARFDLGPRRPSRSVGGDADSPTLLPIIDETDIVKARTIGRELCGRIGFSSLGEIRAATVVSELARNIVKYAGGGEIVFTTERLDNKPCIRIHAHDDGPGIPNIDLIMSGKYKSKTGLGMGLLGTKRLCDDFRVTSRPGQGTDVVARMVVQ